MAWRKSNHEIANLMKFLVVTCCSVCYYLCKIILRIFFLSFIGKAWKIICEIVWKNMKKKTSICFCSKSSFFMLPGARAQWWCTKSKGGKWRYWVFFLFSIYFIATRNKIYFSFHCHFTKSKLKIPTEHQSLKMRINFLLLFSQRAFAPNENCWIFISLISFAFFTNFSAKKKKTKSLLWPGEEKCRNSI